MSKLIRDNKNILNLLANKAYPYQDIVETRVLVHYYTSDGLACFRTAFLLYLKTTRDMYTWVESKQNLFYCLDTSKLFRYSNLVELGIGGSTKFNSSGFSGNLLNYIMTSICYSLNNTKIEDINRMLHFYGITGTEYNSFNGLCNDTHVYKAFETKLVDEVVFRSDKVIQDFFDEVELYKSIKDKLINGTMLPLMRYDTKTQNVYVPNVTNVYSLELMSRAGSGKDGRRILIVDNFINGRDNFSDRDRLFILSSNDYDIPLGGAF